VAPRCRNHRKQRAVRADEVMGTATRECKWKRSGDKLGTTLATQSNADTVRVQRRYISSHFERSLSNVKATQPQPNSNGARRDSKSSARKGVRVRVSPPVVLSSQRLAAMPDKAPGAAEKATGDRIAIALLCVDGLLATREERIASWHRSNHVAAVFESSFATRARSTPALSTRVAAK
jgi:hypothetical protein